MAEREKSPLRIGVLGLGKLGYPVATAMAHRGADVTGFDVCKDHMTLEPRPYVEAWLGNHPDSDPDFNDYIPHSKLKFGSFDEVCSNKDIIFVAVQTPHRPLYEGITPLPATREDFDYTFLVNAVRSMMPYIKSDTVIAIISTVLPGTIRREILPLCHKKAHVVYNPSFIAMGTTVADFLDPEFVLIGDPDYPSDYGVKLRQFYRTILDKPSLKFCMMDLESAELTKVGYNTVISHKVAFANTVMEISQLVGADCDRVIDALSLATRRVISPAYMRGGMGDGGSCHPRDNIAMSWLARELGLSHDIFEDAMKARQDQSRWLADIVKNIATKNNLPIIILGYAYKPNVAIVNGSPALLVWEMLDRRAELVDPFIPPYLVPSEKAVFLIGCKHDKFFTWQFPRGSVVIDPHRYIPDQEGIKVVRLGEKRND
jgi:UDPglucose 6-dehydrogenase